MSTDSKQVGVQCYTASGIIKSVKASAIAELSKEVRDVKENQDYLIHGVQKIIEAGERRFILDGHFTLVSQGLIKTIGVEVFARLDIDAVVVYQDDPQRIHDRLQKRDNKDWDVTLLAAYQDAELQHAGLVTTVLRVPMVHLNAFDSSGLIETVNKVWRLSP